VIKTSQGAGHGQSQQQQTAGFGRSLEPQPRTERRDINQARHFDPLVVHALTALHAHGQRQFKSLALSPRFFITLSGLYHQAFRLPCESPGDSATTDPRWAKDIDFTSLYAVFWLGERGGFGVKYARNLTA
jgi:hypothetical protein